MTATRPAGWYADPEMVDTRRYWDGEAWTEHRQEMTSAAPPPVLVQQADEPSPLAVGWGLVFAILLPIVGLLIGLALLGKRGNDGIKVVVLSVVVGLVWLWIFQVVAAENRKDACTYQQPPGQSEELTSLICGN